MCLELYVHNKIIYEHCDLKTLSRKQNIYTEYTNIYGEQQQ